MAAAAGDVEKHVLLGRPAVAADQVAGRPAIDDMAVLHHDDVVAQPLDLGHVVRGEHDRGAAFAAVTVEMVADPIGGVGVERGGRLVEQQNLRPVDQRLGKADPGFLAGRQAAGRPVQKRRQVERFGELCHPAGGVPHAVQAGEDGKVLPYGHGDGG